jgi:hypothetical protein
VNKVMKRVIQALTVGTYLDVGSKHDSSQWRTQEFFSGGGGGSTNSVEDRERGAGGGSPLLRGSGGSCNLVQEISFYIVNVS